LKILLVGASGTLGGAVALALAGRHEIVPVRHRAGPLRVELGDPESIRALYRQVGPVDAVVSTAGVARFGPLPQLSDDDFELGLRNKLMGQVNLVRFGLDVVRDGGSFTLSSGSLAREPMPGGSAIGLANAGLEGFVRGAALDLPRGLRINVVSSPWVTETLIAMGRDPVGALPAVRVARAYVASVEGTLTGEVLDPRRH
jgi:NAD(P)-dependent dehydrogenase (short-subunit alcohol dehydrogenase family)